ncbi:MAG: hypothetical protein PHQ27_08635 [Victivallales bacterium]|nr:hypothetical protein [Victivallales bacterium]
MRIDTPAETLGFQGISDRLQQVIARLTEATRQLQAAIIARKPDRVWTILEQQQEMMRDFDHYNYLWKQLIVDTGLDSPQIRRAKSEIRSGMTALKCLGDRNAILVRSFLSAIGRAFKKAGEQVSGKAKIYGKRGRMSGKPSSLLIDRLG